MIQHPVPYRAEQVPDRRDLCAAVAEQLKKHLVQDVLSLRTVAEKCAGICQQRAPMNLIEPLHLVPISRSAAHASIREASS
jgi:hypothetical protein